MVPLQFLTFRAPAIFRGLFVHSCSRPNYRGLAARALSAGLIVGVALLGLSACLGGGSGTSTGFISWEWVGGTSTIDIGGTYDTQGTAGGEPGARQAPAQWTDSAGNLWLFGGEGYPTAGTTIGYLNDLWEFTPSSAAWTWVSGSSSSNVAGVYGTLGTGSATTIPGAREGAASWTDSDGNFWMFGGVGYDSAGTLGDLDDLWEFTPSSGQWTWINGSEVANTVGVYGTRQVAAASNLPGARQFMAAWKDSAGNFWMFGGVGFDGSSVTGQLNDLWKFNPSTRQWTWIAGGATANAAGDYGTLGAAVATNSPGSRGAPSYWVDPSGNFWLFGGTGYDSAGSVGYLNDLWKYSTTSGLWTWVSGANTVGAAGSYGTQGTAASSDVPGAREGASNWIDASGNLWLFGGQGANATGSAQFLNDMWEYDPSSGEWNFLSGSATADAIAAYGTEGKASRNNVPGARASTASWTDPSGNFWLFGGVGLNPNANAGELNDLWKATP